MSTVDTGSAVRILHALNQVAKEWELSAVILPFLQNAFAACLSRLADLLFLHRHGDGQDDQEVQAICSLLSKILDGPAAEDISAELRTHCADALSQILVQHPTNHEVQVNAQWALTQIAGVQRTLQVVKPLFSSPTAIAAFLWTATDTREALDWESQQFLLTNAVALLANQEHPIGMDVQRRCYDLIGTRLSADAVLGSPSNEAERQMLAANSVQALLYGVTSLLDSEPKAATQAAEALWKVCRGSLDEPACNPGAQKCLSVLEIEQRVLFTMLQKQSKKSSDLQRYLMDLLGIAKGLPGVIELLQGADGDTLKWSILKSIEHLSSFQASDAAIAVRSVLSAVGQAPLYFLLEQAVKALATLIEGIQAQMTIALVGTSDIAIAVQMGAEAVLEFVMQYQEAKDWRWPAKSARTLRAAAFVDARSREALAKSETLKAAATQRIAGACQRHDSNTYPELEGTFALALTLWGIGYALKIFHMALRKPDDLHIRARHDLIQAMCRVLSGTQEDLESQDAMAIIEAILDTNEQLQLIQEQSLHTLGPMAAVLGHALGALEGDCATSQTEGAREMMRKAAEAQAFFLDCILHEDNVYLIQEICWGVRAASSARGGIELQAMVQAGVPARLEAVVERLVQRAHARPGDCRKYDETEALSEALEALARVRGGGFFPTLSLMQQCANVKALQIAALRAMTNIIDDGAEPSPDEVSLLVKICHDGLKLFGSQDERLETSAQRLLGLCSVHHAA